MPFVDQFSAGAAEYAAHRPRYPDALFDTVAGLAGGRALVLDVATGSGQATEGLTPRFAQVIGIDGGIGQLLAEDRRAGVHLAVGVAEALPVRDVSCDAVTVAQALHWFDRPTFFAEVGRVLRDGGILAVWLYMLAEVTPEVDAVLRRFHTDVVGPFWLAGRRLVDEGYRGIELPFPEVAVPDFVSEAELSLSGYLSYVATWSAVARCRRETGHDPVADLAKALGDRWGTTDPPRTVRWPIRLRVAVKH